MGEYVALSKVRAWRVHGVCVTCMCMHAHVHVHVHGMCMACVHEYVALFEVENLTPHPSP